MKITMYEENIKQALGQGTETSMVETVKDWPDDAAEHCRKRHLHKVNTAVEAGWQPPSMGTRLEYLDPKERASVPALDAIIDKKFPVLNDGFVMVKDYMGGDHSVVQAARVSYGAGTKKVSEDRHLIRYLMRHRHSTPFEMPTIELLVRVPMDAWRQWIRHRTASVNEYSTRYSIAIDDKQITLPDEWRAQAKNNKQGSGDYLPASVGKKLSLLEKVYHKFGEFVYKNRLESGVAREQARKDLPLSTYTEAYWKMDLHNLLHFLALRMDPHAQKEIRDYATLIGNEIVSKWCPAVWEAFEDYRLNAMYLTKHDIEVIKYLVNKESVKATNYLNSKGLLSYKASNGLLMPKSNRERDELNSKLIKLGFDTSVFDWEVDKNIDPN